MDKLFGMCGPTASGKTEIAIRLCEMLGGEVVSADSMQLYKGMDILSAQPTPDEQRRAKHHLIAIQEPSEKFNASKYSVLAQAAVEDIRSKGRLPILCGGTGLYIDALTKGMRMSEKADESLRAELKAEAEKPGGMFVLHDRLKALDPEAAAKYPPEDVRRVVRSLEINILTGKTRALQEAEDALIPDRYEAHLYALSWNRDKLYERINRRVDKMLADGLVQEVERLSKLDAAVQETAAQAIGYKEILRYVKGEISLEEAADDTRTATRHLAKRQITWFKRDPRVKWIAADGRTAAQIADEIAADITEELKK